MNKNTVKRGLLPYLFLVLMVFGIYYAFNVLNQKVNVLTYDKLITLLEKNEIEELTIVPKERAVVYEISGKAEGYKKNESFFVRIPLSESAIKPILDSAKAGDGFEIKTKADPESSSLLLIVVNVLPIVLLGGALFFFLTKQVGGANNSMYFGIIRAR